MDKIDPAVDLIQFPDNSTYTGKYIAYRKVTDGTNTYYIPTTIAVDDNGEVVDPGYTSDEQTHHFLRAIILRLDMLNAAVDPKYSAPDGIYTEEY